MPTDPAAGARPRLCIPRPRPGPVAALAATALHENPENHPYRTPLPNPLRTLRGLAPPTPAQMAAFTTALWKPGRLLTVGFRGVSEALVRETMAAAAAIMKIANIKFKFVWSGTPDVRITADFRAGSYSYVGSDILHIPPGEATLNLGWPDDLARTKHELLHTLAAEHEHQNPLANQGKGIPWNLPVVENDYGGPPNNWSPSEIRTQVLDVLDKRLLTNGGYDKYSIMEYPIPVTHVLDPAFAVGWNEDFSAGDVALLRKLYPF